jgi:D-alanyl-D-alanine carboxypeptidase (penicillin-binding protein 5/6)
MPYRLITPPAKKPQTSPKPQAKKSWGVFFSILIILAAGVLVVGTMSYFQAPPKLKPTALELSLPTEDNSLVRLSWPNYGQSAIGAPGYGVLATNGPQMPAPMASVSKVILALSVLAKKPLQPGQQGPTIKLADADVAIYNDYVAKNGSAVAIQAGEEISEYQALEALLLASAGNMADTLARWAFGSVDGYIAHANGYVKSIGLKQTILADASGLSPQTLSTSSDLVLLGIEALKHPVLAGIVSEQLATIPVAGTVYNTNWLLGRNGVVGIKTGSSDEAGGCFLVAANRNIEGQTIILVGAVMGAPNIGTAINASDALVTSAGSGFKTRKVIFAGQIVGQYRSSWGARADAVADKDFSLLLWSGSTPDTKVDLEALAAPKSKDSLAGSIVINAGGQTKSIPVVLDQDTPAPSTLWRILH